MFYKNGKKVIPLNIYEYLTPLALAVWVMDNGKYLNGCIFLPIGFSKEIDRVRLSDALFQCFGLVCSINELKKDIFVIIINKESVKKFQTIVSPYIIPSLKYKIGLSNQSYSYYHKALLNNSLGKRFYSINNKASSSNNSSSAIVSYSNPILLKSAIYKENQNKTGIYQWVNLITGDSYIGSSINLAKRFSNYFSINFLRREAIKTKSIIYFALLKYGHSNFKLDILEYCDPNVLISKEQHYFDLYQPKYNILKKAGSTLGFKHSFDTLAKFKLRKLSKVSLEKLRSHLSNLQPVLTTNKSIKVDIHDFITGLTTTYESVVKAAKAINSHSKTLLVKDKIYQNSKDIIPYKGRYVITILRNGINRENHLQRVELARINLSKGKDNWAAALGKGILVSNVVTNDKVSYNTISDAARALNVSRRTITRRIEDQKVLNGLYRIAYT